MTGKCFTLGSERCAASLGRQSLTFKAWLGVRRQCVTVRAAVWGRSLRRRSVSPRGGSLTPRLVEARLPQDSIHQPRRESHCRGCSMGFDSGGGQPEGGVERDLNDCHVYDGRERLMEDTREGGSSN